MPVTPKIVKGGTNSKVKRFFMILYGLGLKADLGQQLKIRMYGLP